VLHFLLPTSDDHDKQWRISMAFAVGVHLLLFLVSYLGPKLLWLRPKMPEVYTVNLFTVQYVQRSAPAAAPAPAPAPPAPVETKTKPPEPVKPPPPTPVAPKPPEPVPVAEDAISLKPIKTKEKADIDKMKKLRDQILAEEKAKKAKEDLEKAKAEADKARAEADRARAEADKKLKDAMANLKQSIKAGQQLSSGRAGAGSAAGTVAGKGTGAGAGSGVAVAENLRIYLLAVNNHIQERWILPDLQSWKENLEAVIVIRVKRDGTIIHSFFEKKADNVYFNQFVEKTLKDSSPLPPFPVGIDEEEMEIGLKFKPGEVF